MLGQALGWRRAFRLAASMNELAFDRDPAASHYFLIVDFLIVADVARLVVGAQVVIGNVAETLSANVLDQSVLGFARQAMDRLIDLSRSAATAGGRD